MFSDTASASGVVKEETDVSAVASASSAEYSSAPAAPMDKSPSSVVSPPAAAEIPDKVMNPLNELVKLEESFVDQLERFVKKFVELIPENVSFFVVVKFA